MKHFIYATFSIDATLESSLCGFVNDSPAQYSNCIMKKFVVEKIPYLCLVAIKNVAKFEELRYNYGDSSNLIWRKYVSIYLHIVSLCKYFTSLFMNFINSYVTHPQNFTSWYKQIVYVYFKSW